MLEAAQARGRNGGHWEQAEERRIKSRPVVQAAECERRGAAESGFVG